MSIEDSDQLFHADILLRIYSFLDGSELLRAASVSCQFCDVAYTAPLWHELCADRWETEAENLKLDSEFYDEDFENAISLKNTYLRGCPRSCFTTQITSDSVSGTFRSSGVAYAITGNFEEKKKFVASIRCLENMRPFVALHLPLRIQLIIKNNTNSRTVSLGGYRLTKALSPLGLTFHFRDKRAFRWIERGDDCDVRLLTRIGEAFTVKDDQYPQLDDGEVDGYDTSDDEEQSECSSDSDSEEEDDDDFDIDEEATEPTRLKKWKGETFHSDVFRREPEPDTHQFSHRPRYHTARSKMFPGKGKSASGKEHKTSEAGKKKSSQVVQKRKYNPQHIVADLMYISVSLYTEDSLQNKGPLLLGEALTTVRLFADDPVSVLFEFAKRKLNSNDIRLSPLPHQYGVPTLVGKQDVDLGLLKHLKLRDIFKNRTVASAFVHSSSTENPIRSNIHFKFFNSDSAEFIYDNSITSLQQLLSHSELVKNDRKLQVYHSKGLTQPVFISENSFSEATTSPGSLFLFQFINKIPLLERGRISLLDSWVESRSVTIRILPSPNGLAEALSEQQEFSIPTMSKTFDGRKISSATIHSDSLVKELKAAIGLRNSVNVSVFFLNNELEQTFTEISILELEYFRSGIYYSFDLSTAEHEATPDEVAKARQSYLKDVTQQPQQTTTRFGDGTSSSVTATQQAVRELSQEERRAIYEAKFGSMGTAKRTLHNEEVRSNIDGQKEAHRQTQIERKKREMMADKAAKEQEKRDVYDRMKESQTHVLGDTLLGRERLSKKVENEKEEFRKAKQERDRLASLKERDFRAAERARVKQEYEEQKNELTKRSKIEPRPQQSSSSSSPCPAPKDLSTASICFRLPNGDTKESEFSLDASLASARLWLLHNTPEYHDSVDLVKLMCPYPRRPYTDDELQSTLAELKFARKTQIMVHIAKE